LASPYVRGLIKEKKLDIRAIRGTGQNRRITEADIEKYLSDQQSKIQEKETKM
jgi:pyruvate/2-oxoglutarate dehydrogenase complex dihydrolipoamide acyltransferase (E2) component